MSDYSAELRALTVLAKGGNRSDSVLASHYSVGVLNKKLKLLRAKSGAKNNTHLVAILLRAGKIDYPPYLTPRPVARSLR